MAQVQPTQPTEEIKKQGNRLYCRFDLTSELLRGMFEKYGKVQESSLRRGPRGHLYGFVSYETEGEATKALADLNGKALSTGPMTVELANAERRPRASRPAHQPRQQQAAPANQAAPAQQQPRQRRGPKPQQQQQQQQQPANGATQEQRPRQRRPRKNQRRPEMKNPLYGQQVILMPDPMTQAVDPKAKFVELSSPNRQYRPNVTEAKAGAILELNIDRSKPAPFGCDFKIDEFALKLLSVRVNCKPGDCRVTCRIAYPDGHRNRDIYMRIRENGENRHKFFELIKPSADPAAQTVETFFLGIDRIVVDPATNMWNKLVLSLSSAMLPRRVPKPKAEAQPAQAQPAPVQA